MDFKDYYAVLGVEPDADEQTIKQAYRKLARQYHPDVNPGDKAAEERFKEVSEAYEALSNPERRRTYDQRRREYEQWQRGGGRGGFAWDAQAAPGATYTSTISPEDLEDLFGGESPFSDFFGSIYGRVAEAPGGPRARGPRPGRDIEAAVEITLEEAFHGTTRALQVGDRRIEARIPRGVDTGTRVRLAGQGGPGRAGGPPGDLFLVIEVLPHPRFERDGDDLTVEVDLDAFTAAVGGQVRVPTLEGPVTLKIPPRTQAGRTFRLRGRGMPRAENPDERGNLYAQVRLVLPEPLSDAELEALRSLAEARRR